MPNIGSISHFNEAEETFEAYCDRVELFFLANDISAPTGDTADKRVASFLTLGGPHLYKLATSLLSPIAPKNASYPLLISKLKGHFKPTVIIIYERYKFHTRSQQQGESISDFVAALKSLAHTCGFEDVLNDMLQDRFVCGIHDDDTKYSLLSEKDLTFSKAVEMASAREAATHDVKAMTALTVKAISGPRPPIRRDHAVRKNAKQMKAFPNSSTPKQPCQGCGGQHWKKDCPFREAECFGCHKKGHIKKMCRNRKTTALSLRENAETTAYNVGVTPHSKDWETSKSPIPEEVSYDYLFNVSDVHPSMRDRPF